MLGWWLPENVATYGGGVFHLVYWTSGLGLLVAQALLSRTRRATTTHSHPLLEMIWATVPALILVWLGLLSHRSSHEIPGNGPQIALESTTADGHARLGAP